MFVLKRAHCNPAGLSGRERMRFILLLKRARTHALANLHVGFSVSTSLSVCLFESAHVSDGSGSGDNCGV